MPRFIEGQDRHQVTLLPECLDDLIAEDNTGRIVNVFICELYLVALDFDGASPAAIGRPSYHPAMMLRHLFAPQVHARLQRMAAVTATIMAASSRP